QHVASQSDQGSRMRADAHQKVKSKRLANHRHSGAEVMVVTAGFAVQAWTGQVMGFQLWGSNSLRRVMECAGMRESTSWNHANGSTPHRLQEAMKLRSTAAVLPPLSPPKKVQYPRPSTMS